MQESHETSCELLVAREIAKIPSAGFPVRGHGLHRGDGITGIHIASLPERQAGPGPALPCLPAGQG